MINKDLQGLIKTIGPGILFAGAAIGGSHLIQSTRAGADYGFSLLIIVILANLFKYPFFEFSYRYTSAKGKSLLEGYDELGRWALWTFLGLSVITGVINIAALALSSSSVLGYILNQQIDPLYISIVLVLFCITLLLIGKYPLLDKAMKFMVVTLAICTTIAFFMSLTSTPVLDPNFVEQDLFAKSGVLFVIALMGWMPAPIESSIWTSLWTLGRIKQEKYVPTLKETLIDFHIGYIGTAVLAVFFLTLGAMTMYGTGVGFSNNGTEFSKQVIELYTNLFGQWSAWIIAPAAFLTLFSSLLTCVDAYPRSLAGGLFLVNRKLDSSKNNIYFGLMVLMSLISLIIVSFLSKNLKVMMDLATVISFLAAPVFAIINYKIVTSIEFPKDKQPKLWLKALSRMGIVFLVGFSIIYIWTLFFLN